MGRFKCKQRGWWVGVPGPLAIPYVPAIASIVNEVKISGHGVFLSCGLVSNSEVDQSATLIARFPMPHMSMKIALQSNSFKIPYLKHRFVLSPIPKFTMTPLMNPITKQIWGL